VLFVRAQSASNRLSAASAIGPYAVAYTEEKLGGLREFMNAQRQPELLMDLNESSV
jgi:hypothetical protein